MMSPYAEQLAALIRQLGFNEQETGEVALILREIVLEPGINYFRFYEEHFPMMDRLLSMGLLVRDKIGGLHIRPIGEAN